MIRSGEHYGRKIQLFGEVQLRLKAHSFYDIMRKGRKDVIRTAIKTGRKNKRDFVAFNILI